MPDYFSHGIIAELVLEKLENKYKSKIKDKSLYFLGAQGCDVFFTYNANFTKSNLGRMLHRKAPFELFTHLLDGNISYAAGFATHYALDCTLHPFIYAYENSTFIRKISPFSHPLFESDLGLYLSRKFLRRRQIMLEDNILSCTTQVYDSIKKIAPQITVMGIENCLKRYYLYSVFLFKTKRQEFKCDYDFKKLDPYIEHAQTLSLTAAQNVLDKALTKEIFSLQFLQK